MNKSIVISAVFMLLFGLSSRAQSQEGIFKKGQRGAAANFTGTVWVTPLVPDDSTLNCVVGNVNFEAGARARWHRHPAGQILLVTAGTGYYQEKGKIIRLLHKGDVITCKPGVEHWHGASAAQGITHVAINPNTGNGIVVWLKPVTDEEYRKAPKS